MSLEDFDRYCEEHDVRQGKPTPKVRRSLRSRMMPRANRNLDEGRLLLRQEDAAPRRNLKAASMSPARSSQAGAGARRIGPRPCKKTSYPRPAVSKTVALLTPH